MFEDVRQSSGVERSRPEVDRKKVVCIVAIDVDVLHSCLFMLEDHGCHVEFGHELYSLAHEARVDISRRELLVPSQIDLLLG